MPVLSKGWGTQRRQSLRLQCFETRAFWIKECEKSSKESTSGNALLSESPWLIYGKTNRLILLDSNICSKLERSRTLKQQHLCFGECRIRIFLSHRLAGSSISGSAVLNGPKQLKQ